MWLYWYRMKFPISLSPSRVWRHRLPDLPSSLSSSRISSSSRLKISPEITRSMIGLHSSSILWIKAAYSSVSLGSKNTFVPEHCKYSSDADTNFAKSYSVQSTSSSSLSASKIGAKAPNDSGDEKSILAPDIKNAPRALVSISATSMPHCSIFSITSSIFSITLSSISPSSPPKPAKRLEKKSPPRDSSSSPPPSPPPNAERKSKSPPDSSPSPPPNAPANAESISKSPSPDLSLPLPDAKELKKSSSSSPAATRRLSARAAVLEAARGSFARASSLLLYPCWPFKWRYNWAP
mmetsp:Transcript_15170/g.32930  ORF Transcript_15170/g.32930 Transcript_15170/m.32930 type:complete len:293 (+) Transcript_15170:932-1810(+)